MHDRHMMNLLPRVMEEQCLKPTTALIWLPISLGTATAKHPVLFAKLLASLNAALASGGNGHRPEQLLVPGVPGGLATDQRHPFVRFARLQEGAMVNQVLTRIFEVGRQCSDYHSKPIARYKCWPISSFRKLNHLRFDASCKTQEVEAAAAA